MKELLAVLILVLLIAMPIGMMKSSLKILDDAQQQQSVVIPAPQIIDISGASPVGPAPVPIIATRGEVTVPQLFQLAINAGWNLKDAIVAVAISLSEDPWRSPTATSPPNGNKTVDFCLWQINSIWWNTFGGQQALADPQTCANAAHVIWLHGGWTQWCTYPGGCGGGPGSPSFPANLRTAQQVAGSLP